MIGASVFVGILLGVYLGPLLWSKDAQFVPPVVDMIELRDMRPIYTVLWDSGAKVSWAHPLGTDNLARDYLARIEDATEVRADFVGVGAERDATIERANPFDL